MQLEYVPSIEDAKNTSKPKPNFLSISSEWETVENEKTRNAIINIIIMYFFNFFTSN